MMDLDALRLAEAFFSDDPELLPVVHQLLFGVLERWPETEIITQKSQIGLRDPKPFCAIYPPRKAGDRALHRLGLSLFLHRPLESSRVLQTAEPYPGRWTNHLVLTGPEGLDDVFWSWMEEARNARNPK